MTSAEHCFTCAGRGLVGKFRYGKYAGTVICPACGGSGKRYKTEESLRDFRKRVIERNE